MRFNWIQSSLQDWGRSRYGMAADMTSGGGLALPWRLALTGQVLVSCSMPSWPSCLCVMLQADVLDAFSALAQLAEVAGDPDQAADGSHSPGRKSSDENVSPANGHAPAAAGDASSSHARASSVEDSMLVKRRVQVNPCCGARPSLLSCPNAMYGACNTCCLCPASALC